MLEKALAEFKIKRFIEVETYGILFARKQIPKIQVGKSIKICRQLVILHFFFVFFFQNTQINRISYIIQIRNLKNLHCLHAFHNLENCLYSLRKTNADDIASKTDNSHKEQLPIQPFAWRCIKNSY